MTMTTRESRPLDGRRCLVVGATGGIGSACVGKLLQQGANVVLAGHSPGRLRHLVHRLEEQGFDSDRLAPLSVDLRFDMACDALLKHAVSTLGGPPEVVINAAGVGRFGSFEAQEITDLLDQVELNLNGTVRLVHACVEALIETKGVFIQLLSGLAHSPKGRASVYVATQHALKGLIGSLRMEYGGRGAKFATVTVAGAGVDTRFWDKADPRTPRGAMMAPERVSEAVLTVLLSSHESLMDDLRIRTP